MTSSNLTAEQAMASILAMLAATREDALARDKSIEPRKTEIVLADSGLTPFQIGQLLGKKSKSVSQTILRARSKAGDGANDG